MITSIIHNNTYRIIGAKKHLKSEITNNLTENTPVAMENNRLKTSFMNKNPHEIITFATIPPRKTTHPNFLRNLCIFSLFIILQSAPYIFLISPLTQDYHLHTSHIALSDPFL